MTCSVCASPKQSFLYASRDRMFDLPGKFSIYRCYQCGLLTLRPKLSAQKQASYYPSEQYYSYQSSDSSFFEKLRTYLIFRFYYPTIWSRLFMFCINTVPAIPKKRMNGRILDIGCGSGKTLKTLQSLGWKTYGIEMDKEAVKRAKAQGLDVKIGTYKDVEKYQDNFFDVIRLYHVLEHIDNPALCISLCRKKLKKGGELIIGTPNGKSVAQKVFGSYWYNLDSPRHMILFSPDNLSLLLGKKSFQISDISFCSGGGILGSIQYIFSDMLKKRITLLDSVFLFFLFYPLEWFFDRIHVGDVFIITGRKIS